MATSRAPLGVDGETEWRIPPLSPSGAVELFVDRAGPGFELTLENAAAVETLCKQLDGLPLAIELAAARIRVLTVEQLVARLSDRFRLLSRGPRTASERQRTLRASVDWSYELLSAGEQQLLRRVAVFVGGFTLEAAEQVCDGTVDLLGSLVEQSLVVAEPRAHAMRYRLLETVREYGLERLAAAREEEAVRDRHRETFLALAEEAAPHLESPRQAVWLARLEPEAANLAAALEHALQSDPPAALRLCIALFPFWRVRGRFAEAALAQSRALAAGADAPPGLRARVWVTSANRSIGEGDLEAARTGATEALALAELAGDRAAAARARTVLGNALQFSQPAAARTEFARAAELARAAGDDWALIHAHLGPAFGATLQNDHALVMRLSDAVTDVVERSGEPYEAARRHYFLGMVAVNDGRPADARDEAARARAAVADVWEPIQETAADIVEGLADVWSGHAELVLERMPGRLAHAQHVGAGLSVPALIGVLAFAELAAGRLSAARERFLGLAALTEGRNGFLSAFTLNMLAEIQRLLCERDAWTTAARAREVAGAFGNRLLATRAQLTLARLAAADGDWTTAQQHALAHLDACADGGHESWVPGCLDALGEIAADLGTDVDAVRLFAAGERIRAELGIVRVIPEDARWKAIDARLRAALGDAYEAAFAEGAALTVRDTLEWARRARGPRKRPAAGWEALTPTEVRVAKLVSQGLSNRQIGDRMFISGETVKTHVGHVLVKLAVRNRAELAAFAARHDTR